ncbi:MULTISPECIES: hypothetical protein [Achromobacter]|uniref:Uncharacterized protein n=1 Tax=Achromobacter spanius TaxID=217203 RepID=A0ABY8GSE4_9BURK|nr:MULTISPECIES: hypothetical protein [Achromobacter]WAI83226.1 hypothetical protein N8Z00_27655 [Achromobacter spanius]WEX93311.1 hypothetical protein N3Z32_22250 [Achromobacter sp. SS2-2022]WFP07531.1 hypothetical protein P8T11_25000 [Achromobacter spanius]
MGLDVTAYARIKKLDAVFDEDGEPIDPTTREPLEYDFKAYRNPDFPGRADDIEDRAIYWAENAVSLYAGYGGYNVWREELARVAGYQKGKYKQFGRDWDSHCVGCWSGATGPFSELINFSDCEGTIGPSICAKLARDFADFDERAKAHDGVPGRPGWFYELYQEFRTAFEMAADSGAVHFH